MQFLNRYEIREDGALWWLAAHVESVSAPEPRGLMRFFGPKPPTTRTTHCWEHEPSVTGEVMFYGTTPDGRWVEFVADFVDGQLQQLRCILDEPESFGTP